MPRVSHWQVELSTVVEIELADYYGYGDAESEVWTCDDLQLPSFLGPLMRAAGLPYGHYHLEVEFQSKGFYDPGQTYGDPYNCYPPDGEDIRTLSPKGGLKLISAAGKPLLDLTPRQQSEIFDTLQPVIDAVPTSHSAHNDDF